MTLRGIHLENPRDIIQAVKRVKEEKHGVLAFLGGSITQGSLATKPETCYAYLVYEWWKKTYPDVSFTYINAGIGGTNSLFGAARVEEDVLSCNPDFLILDFSVNDDNTDFFMETYESLIVRILSHSKRPGVMALCNAFYEDGSSAYECHKKVLDHYSIPYVSVRETLYQDILDGKTAIKDITPDGLHPNDEGHKKIADLVTMALEEIKGMEPVSSEETGQANIPVPLTPCSYQYASRIQNNITPFQCRGFLPDDSVKCGVTDVFKRGWISRRMGDRIVFETEGSCLSVQYRKTIKRPAPVAAAYVDGDRDHGVILDGNFDEEWGDCLALTTLLHHGKPGKHVVEIEILKGVEEEETPFYLVSIIQSGTELESNTPMDRHSPMQ